MLTCITILEFIITNLIYLSLLFYLFAIFTMKYKEKNPKRIFLETSLFFLFGFLSISYFAANYFTGHGINDAVIAALNLGFENAGFEEYILLILTVFGAFVALFVMAFFHYTHLKSVKIQDPKRIKAFVHNGFLLLAFLSHPTLHDLKNIYEAMTLEQANDFYEYYKTPDYIAPAAEQNKKNIVYIYAESLEKTYFDPLIFPNLTPNLSALIQAQNATEFTNIVQTTGTNYTIAGTLATQCGLALFSTSDGNTMDGVDKFYPKATCIGDILKKEHYYLSALQGGSTKFSGTDKFYKTHKFDAVEGREALLPKLRNKKYVNGWGLYDDTMLDFAYSKYEQLSISKEPFALFLHTLDTHHPNGHLSKSCAKSLYGDGKNSILNTVKCSDILLSKFIKKIQNSKDANNTIIVITSDHLAMRNTASKQLEKSDARRNLFVVFDSNTSLHVKNEKIGTPFDEAATVLSFIGIDTDLGLGRNLRQKESLYAAFDDFDTKVHQWREDILSFWEFPKMAATLTINTQKKLVYLGENTYKFPVLFRVLQESVEPYFQTEDSWKLYDHLDHFHANEQFLWIDECKMLNYIFDTNTQAKQCVAEGILGQEHTVKELKSASSYTIQNFSNIPNENNATLEKIKSNIATLIRNNGKPL